MLKSGKFVAGTGVALICLALVAATFALTAPASQPPAQAAQAAQATPVSDSTKSEATPTASTNPAKPANGATKSSGADEAQYLAAFNKDFAAKLGVSEDVLNTAFAGAVADTADQLVKDGKISPDEATKTKEAAKKGLIGFLPLLDRGGNIGADNGPLSNPKDMLLVALTDVARLLNLSPDDLNSKLQNGQSLADLAAAAKVDVQKVKDTILASFKTQFDAMVKAGKITQAESDNMYKKFSAIVDDFVSPNRAVKPNGGIYERLLGDTTWQVLAQLLNLPVNSLKDQVKMGKSILDIAQAQNVDETKLRDGLQASMKAQLDDMVKKGEITQDVADQTFKDVPNLISKFIGGKPNQK